jgi:hypothetical protein
LEDQRRCGKLIRRRGTVFLVQHKIETAADATRAIKEGVALERSAEQLPALVYAMLTMSDEGLKEEHRRLTAQAVDVWHRQQTNGHNGRSDRLIE